MNICIYGASSPKIDPAYLQMGELLGEKMAQKGHGLVFGGGACGMMGAVAKGMHRYGGQIIGVAPSFFDVDGVLFPHCTELIYTETMRQRKQIMEDRSDGFLALPGGVGTFEEFFEILTLRQLGRMQKPIVLLNQNGYYDPLCALIDRAVLESFAREATKELFLVTDDIDAALSYLEAPPTLSADVRVHKFLEQELK